MVMKMVRSRDRWDESGSEVVSSRKVRVRVGRTNEGARCIGCGKGRPDTTTGRRSVDT